MNLKEIFGDFDYVYNFGPSSLGNGIIDVRGLQDWVKKHYVGKNNNRLDDSLDDYLIFNRNRFFSGKIYSFRYDGKGPDLHPMFMSVTNMIQAGDRLFEMGININYLTPKDRVKLFKGIITAFPSQIQENIEKIETGARDQNDLPFIHEEYRKRFFDLIDLHPRLVKIDRSKIMKDTIKAVKYEDWKYLIYYLPVTFVNVNPVEMYKGK